MIPFVFDIISGVLSEANPLRRDRVFLLSGKLIPRFPLVGCEVISKEYRHSFLWNIIAQLQSSLENLIQLLALNTNPLYCNQMSDLIRVPTQEPELKREQTKKVSFLKELHRLLMNDTHLGQYMPILSETQQAKNVRMINDQCYFTLEFERKEFWKYLLPKYEPLDPSRALMNFWYVWVILVIIYYYIEIGLVLTYGEQVWNDEMDYTLTYLWSWLAIIILVVDMFLMLNKGYFSEGILIMDRKRILSNYLKYHFLIDFFTIIILFLCLVTQSYGMNWAKLWMMLKLYSLSKIDKIYQRKLQVHRLRKTIYVIIRLLLIVLLISHVMGLFFYSLDYYIYSNGIYAPQFCWLYSSTAYTGIINQPWNIQYLYSLYWGVNTMTTISYGDIAGNNPIEVVYMLFCFILAFVIYGYVLNHIVRVILWAKEVAENFRSELIVIDTFMRRKEINQALQIKIREYLEFLYSEENQRDIELENMLISKLPGQLRESLIKDAYKMFYLMLLGPFSDFRMEFVNQLIFNIKEQKFANNESIFQQDDEQETHCLYLIQKGTVNLIVQYGNNKEELLSIVEGPDKLFGSLQFYTGERRRYKAVSDGPSNVYYLQKSALNQVLNTFIMSREHYRLLLDRTILKKEYNYIGFKCEKCKRSHKFQQCDDCFPQIRRGFFLKTKPKTMKQSLKLSRKHTTKSQNVFRAQRKNLKSDTAHYYKHTPKMQFQHIIRQKIESRLSILQEQISLVKEKFEVDQHFDWGYYELDWNYSKVEKIINSICVVPKHEQQQSGPLQIN